MPVLTKAPLRVLCDGMKGENYWTHGCMAYMAACLGLPEAYHYQFFNCYSGDSVTLLAFLNSEWAYVETTIENQPCRAFIPRTALMEE